MKNHRIQYLAISLLLLLCLLLIAFSPASSAQTSDGPNLQERRENLERLRKAVAGIADQIETQRAKQSRLQKKIKKHDIELAKTAKESFALKQETKSLDSRKDELDGQQKQLKIKINQQREAIAAQVVAAYHLREHNQIAQWLSQKNPVAARRQIEALGLISSHTNTQLVAFENSLQDLASIESALKDNQAKLAVNLEETANKEKRLREQRDKRLKLLASLQEEIAKNEKRHAQSVSEENELEDLLASLEINAEIKAKKALLKSSEVAQANFEKGRRSGFSGPFGQAKGKLFWPTKGAQITSYGSKKQGSSSRSKGVMIAGNAGSPVYSIFPGVVIFADYLPAQGMLMIIDHGDGYWSLYGHNESLLSSVGDYVEESQPIATVGASGGLKSASLYFEIRQKGQPTNPADWCQRS